MAAWLSHFMILDREAVFSTPGASVLYPLPCIASPETFGKKSLVGTRSRKGAGRYAGPPSRRSVRETGKSLVGTRDRQIGGRYAGGVIHTCFDRGSRRHDRGVTPKSARGVLLQI